jgi:hypothetical protein
MEYRKDPDVSPFMAIKDELYEAKGLIYQMNQIVLPEKLQKKMIKIAHEMGHFGKNKNQADDPIKVLVPDDEHDD